MIKTEQKPKEIIDLDDYIFGLNKDTTIETPISVELYNEQRNLQTKDTTFIDLSMDDHVEDPDVLCEICFEKYHEVDTFPIKTCTHVYCRVCMASYVASKLQENITQIPCPVLSCKGSLEPQQCSSLLPREVFDRWCSALCEATILGSHKFYCPFKDCSALLVDDEKRGVVIRESECPICRRLFCAQCRVPWHSEIGCEEFQKLHKDEREREDVLLMKLASSQRWRRCPKCRIFVEKIVGCEFMRCRI